MMQVIKKKKRHHSLTGRITPEIMQKAYKNVKRNRGAAGIDKVSIGMYEQNLQQNLEALMHKLKTDTYEAKPLRRKLIPKGGGKFRPIGIPGVRYPGKDNHSPGRGVILLEPPNVRKIHAGKYREMTLLRQRGGGWRKPPPYLYITKVIRLLTTHSIQGLNSPF